MKITTSLAPSLPPTKAPDEAAHTPSKKPSSSRNKQTVTTQRRSPSQKSPPDSYHSKILSRHKIHRWKVFLFNYLHIPYNGLTNDAIKRMAKGLPIGPDTNSFFKHPSNQKNAFRSLKKTISPIIEPDISPLTFSWTHKVSLMVRSRTTDTKTTAQVSNGSAILFHILDTIK